jgi:hypothetical protein
MYNLYLLKDYLLFIINYNIIFIYIHILHISIFRIIFVLIVIFNFHKIYIPVPELETVGTLD